MNPSRSQGNHRLLGESSLRIAIVGRPNVGKSALFNRMVRKKVSIVHDRPGITRDRISASIGEHGRVYEFLDTGGIGLPEEGALAGISDAVRLQAEISLETADLVFFVVDAQEGCVPLDSQIAKWLRRASRPVWLIVNKVDHENHEGLDADFARFGFKQSFAVSAIHGRGIGEIWEELKGIAGRDPGDPSTEPSETFTSLAVVGRPNVGKSTLINRLLGAERVIVSEMPGTTRDAVDLPIDVAGRHFVLIDTAGIRHRSKISTSVEVFSKMRTEGGIRRADIVVLVIDASAGMTRQDKAIAGYVQQYAKPCVMVVNKWDLNEQREGKRVRRLLSMTEFEKDLRHGIAFLDYAPILFTSALQGYRAENLWKCVGKVDRARRQQISTGVLNRLFKRAQDKLPAPIRHGKRLKIYYALQKPEAPVPTFVLFVNDRKYLDESYARYLKHSLRRHEPFPGCPLMFELRQKPKLSPGARGRPGRADEPPDLLDG